MSSTAATAEGGRNIKGLAAAQRLGRSLLLPIASLPVAALLARLGAPDLLGADGLGWDEVAAVIGAAGDALFANLGRPVRGRCGDRLGSPGRWLHRSGCRGGVPRLQRGR